MAYEKALSLISGGSNALIVTLNSGTANVSYNDILAAFKAHTPVYLDYEHEVSGTVSGTIVTLAPCFGLKHDANGYEAVFAIPNLVADAPVGKVLHAETADEKLVEAVN